MGDTEAPAIEINFQEKKSEWVFWVRDNGPGIRKTEMKRIFRLFERDSQENNGTGMGLALARKIVNIHGGDIWVESELGKGATFFFAIPKIRTIETNDAKKTWCHWFFQGHWSYLLTATRYVYSEQKQRYRW